MHALPLILLQCSFGCSAVPRPVTSNQQWWLMCLRAPLSEGPCGLDCWFHRQEVRIRHRGWRHGALLRPSLVGSLSSCLFAVHAHVISTTSYLHLIGLQIDKKAAKDGDDDTPEIVRGYKFGKSIVPIPESAMAETKLDSEKSMTLVTFVPSSKVHRVPIG